MSKAPSRRMKGQVYMACIRSCCETWATRAELETKMERTEMRMIKWMCGVVPGERQPSIELRRRLGAEAIGDVMRRCRLRWHGHGKKEKGRC